MAPTTGKDSPPAPIGVERTADQVFAEQGRTLDYLVGTMIELPRAALMAGEIAHEARFFSFGTNDLTQTALGISRDDAGRFLADFGERRTRGFAAMVLLSREHSMPCQRGASHGRD